MYQKRPGSFSTANLISIIIYQSTSLIQSVAAKGGASRGVSASGGGSGVCTDCAGVDTEGEIEASLIVVAIILIIFLTVCSCQCYQKFSWELRSRPGCTSDPDSDKKPMPMAPYMRDNARNNNNNNLIKTSSSAVNFTVNYPNYVVDEEDEEDEFDDRDGENDNNKDNNRRRDNNYYSSSTQYIP